MFSKWKGDRSADMLPPATSQAPDYENAYYMLKHMAQSQTGMLRALADGMRDASPSAAHRVDIAADAIYDEIEVGYAAHVLRHPDPLSFRFMRAAREAAQ